MRQRQRDSIALKRASGPRIAARSQGKGTDFAPLTRTSGLIRSLRIEAHAEVPSAHREAQKKLTDLLSLELDSDELELVYDALRFAREEFMDDDGATWSVDEYTALQRVVERVETLLPTGDRISRKL